MYIVQNMKPQKQYAHSDIPPSGYFISRQTHPIALYTKAYIDATEIVQSNLHSTPMLIRALGVSAIILSGAFDKSARVTHQVEPSGAPPRDRLSHSVPINDTQHIRQLQGRASYSPITDLVDDCLRIHEQYCNGKAPVRSLFVNAWNLISQLAVVTCKRRVSDNLESDAGRRFLKDLG
jgi:hypothetical protein